MPSFSVLRSLKVFLCPDGLNRRHLNPLPAPLWSLNRKPVPRSLRDKLKDQFMKIFRLYAPALAGILFAAFNAPAQFATSVVAYDHGTAFAANFTNPAAALGKPTATAS